METFLAPSDEIGRQRNKIGCQRGILCNLRYFRFVPFPSNIESIGIGRLGLNVLSHPQKQGVVDMECLIRKRGDQKDRQDDEKAYLEDGRPSSLIEKIPALFRPGLGKSRRGFLHD